ncbi:16S rRNA (guanine(527)-N(7))-methyltransferase RsmG [Anaerosoma tenue]|uniref:16S rRNA (guanine(527)-N(7))-methyltransferase RsmG n=1 Tax=Anaerosoma tenue TaxID=2933588 RepID=UPI002260FF71|nr:16S rRNA (guanine(527)-N(7))-methyltransferase RsmG [Anaerosoma tenue]MCK8115175.1 16S rRNA (guanine(527)-N(7))-methyltransferase RsmG [Anaerosoma tenue]
MFHVKHSNDTAPLTIHRVRSMLVAAGIGVSDLQVEALTRHGNSVLLANNTINLTAVIEPEDFVRLHIIDSLLPLGMVEKALGAALDMGTGAGYPGIPWAIGGVSMVLCEATKKKAALLEQWAQEIPVKAEVVSMRAEEYAQVARGRFDTVVARAVSALPSLLELSSPLLRVGGRLVAMKGNPSVDEIAHAEHAAGVLGMSATGMMEYALPGGGEKRTLCVYEKVEEPSIRLPRRSGLAQRRPFGG